ncbi:hypothetical protein HRbin29_00045 [bacterium HR29]|jgi:sulfoxide reductase heme-binding subunit YedZ|nr:hypothetical protein HRbin29_00045 [bacterium HR29]
MRSGWYFAFAAGAAGMVAGWVVGRPLMEEFGGVSGHEAWYVSRAAGLASYLALAASLAVGATMSSAIGDGLVSRARLLAIHQALGVSGLALALAHALALLFDGYTDFDLPSLAVPFAASYEPMLSGLGTLTLYLFALATATFWIRRQIGMRLWRLIHLTSIAAFGGAFVHGVLIGSDTMLGWVQGVYLAGAAAVAGALAVRLTYRRPRRSAVAPVRG